MKNITLSDASRRVLSRPTQDGDGVNIRRIAGGHLNAVLDPFLLIDEIRASDESGELRGFPAHPHRGFQTLSYVIEGGFEHQDSMGNIGQVDEGGLQWMSAARGVIHSEMPLGPNGRVHAYQFWLNLPARSKLDPPRYYDLKGANVPVYLLDSATRVRALLGELEFNQSRISSPLEEQHSGAFLMDITQAEHERLELTIPQDTTLMVLPIHGESEGLSPGSVAVFSATHEVQLLRLSSEAGWRYLVVGGRPIKEPVAQFGPFVMNTMEEVEQALSEYRDGTLLGA